MPVGPVGPGGVQCGPVRYLVKPTRTTYNYIVETSFKLLMIYIFFSVVITVK